MLADLWLVGEMVNRIGIYGSKVAEGLTAFQRRSCFSFPSVYLHVFHKSWNSITDRMKSLMCHLCIDFWDHCATIRYLIGILSDLVLAFAWQVCPSGIGISQSAVNQNNNQDITLWSRKSFWFDVCHKCPWQKSNMLVWTPNSMKIYSHLIWNNVSNI